MRVSVFTKVKQQKRKKNYQLSFISEIFVIKQLNQVYRRVSLFFKLKKFFHYSDIEQ